MKRSNMEVGGPAETPGGDPGRSRPRFPRLGPFARSVLTLMTGTTLATLIPVAVSPVLSRLYPPAEFGLFALYTGVAGLLSVAAAGRYELAIVLPSEDDAAYDLLGLSLLIVGCVTAVTALAVATLHRGILTILGAPAMAGWLWFLPLAVLLLGTGQALVNWLNRRRAYPHIAASRIVQSVATAALAIVFARSGLGGGGLIVSALAGQALAALVLVFAVRSGLRGSALRFTAQGMRRQAARFRDFPRVNALHALFDNLNASATLIVLAHFFGSAVVGQYSMVMRVLTAPVTLIGSAITQVFYQRAADLHNQGRSLRGLILMVIRRSLWIAVPAAVVLLLAAPQLFRFVFGPDWAVAGGFARLLSPYVLLYFVAAPLAFLPFVLGRQVAAFFFSTTGNLVSLGCIALGGLWGSAERGFGLLSLAQSLYFLLYIAWMLRIASAPRAEPA